MKSQTAEMCAQAFNAGCDARLDGVHRHINPYQHKSQLWWMWQHGWMHQHRHYGELARWPIRRMPIIEVQDCLRRVWSGRAVLV